MQARRQVSAPLLLSLVNVRFLCTSIARSVGLTVDAIIALTSAPPNQGRSQLHNEQRPATIPGTQFLTCATASLQLQGADGEGAAGGAERVRLARLAKQHAGRGVMVLQSVTRSFSANILRPACPTSSLPPVAAVPVAHVNDGCSLPAQAPYKAHDDNSTSLDEV